MAHHIDLGEAGERHASEYLTARGFHIVERNWRCHAGEIDIVASESIELVIVEVKTRRNHQCGHPFEALTPSKLARLRRLALLWAAGHGWRGHIRVDALALTATGPDTFTVEHLRAVA